MFLVGIHERGLWLPRFVPSPFKYPRVASRMMAPDSARLAFFTGPKAAVQASEWVGRVITAGFYHPDLHHARSADLFDATVREAGGFTSSLTGRERLVYEHDAMPFEQTRGYLEDRDSIAWAATTGFAEKMWMTFPIVGDARHKDYFAQLQQAQFLKTMRDVEAMARRDGIAYIYIRATGPASSPLESGDRIVAFSPIGHWQIEKNNVERHRGDDPLLIQHGIEKVVINVADENKQVKPIDVHGHRLIPIVRNRGRGYLWPSYDDLWYMKDILFSLKMAQYMGNPIAVKVDIKWLQAISNGQAEDISEPEMLVLKEQFIEQTAKIQSGALHSYAPLKGLEVYRVGESKLDDPLPVLRALASRMSLTMGLSTNRILASSRGSEQVTDEDRTDEMTWVYERQLIDGRPVYDYLLDLLRFVNRVPARTPVLPLDLRWPYTRILNPREEVYVTKSRASALKTAMETGFWLDDEVMRHFRKITEPLDARLLLPKQIDPNKMGVIGKDGEVEMEPPQKSDPQEEADDASVRDRKPFTVIQED